MVRQLLLVSTCGTSVLTNDASEDDRRWLTEVANDVQVDSDPLEAIVAERRVRLNAADEGTRRTMSAELNGIAAVLERYKLQRVFHLLVHTDTALGRKTAELIQGVLGAETALVSAPGLRTNELASFRAALPDLTKQLDDYVRSYRDQSWFVVFNLTGGFKALNAYLQTLAMITADRCVFIFERASELMEIPRLPVELRELDSLREHVDVFRRLAVGYRVTSAEAKGVPEALLYELDGEVTTSPLGDVAWSRHRLKLFAEKLHPPLSSKVRISESVAKAFDGLEDRHKVQVNESLDEFSAYSDKIRPMLKSRKFEKLQGHPVPGSTHELYAWSDGAAGRLFGHYDQDVFVFDDLSKHLA
jgi:putative CRISPR-associated protein (TIGR02619 family)